MPPAPSGPVTLYTPMLLPGVSGMSRLDWLRYRRLPTGPVSAARRQRHGPRLPSVSANGRGRPNKPAKGTLGLHSMNLTASPTARATSVCRRSAPHEQRRRRHAGEDRCRHAGEEQLGRRHVNRIPGSQRMAAGASAAASTSGPTVTRVQCGRSAANRSRSAGRRDSSSDPSCARRLKALRIATFRVGRGERFAGSHSIDTAQGFGQTIRELIGGEIAVPPSDRIRALRSLLQRDRRQALYPYASGPSGASLACRGGVASGFRRILGGVQGGLMMPAVAQRTRLGAAAVVAGLLAPALAATGAPAQPAAGADLLGATVDPVLRDLPQRQAAHRRAEPGRPGPFRGRRSCGGVGEGRGEAAHPIHAAGRPSEARRRDLRPGRGMARVRDRPRRPSSRRTPDARRPCIA